MSTQELKIQITTTLSPSLAIAGWDILQMKKALNRLGYYLPQSNTGTTDEPERALFEALKDFKRKQNLSPTGIAMMNDSTVRRINTELAKPKTGYYVWRTVEDERVRESHAVKDNTIRAWEDAPDPGEDFRCRCWAESAEPLIRGVDDEVIIALVRKGEKFKPYLYRDKERNITVGIGKFLPTVKEAQKISFKIKDPKAPGGERPATGKEIEQAYNKVRDFRRGEKNLKAIVFDPKGSLELDNLLIDEGAAKTLARQHLEEDKRILNTRFPEFKKFPVPAQKALLDMHYNIGGDKFNAQNWKGLFDAPHRQDWRTAAQESHRKDVGIDRNVDVHDLFMDAANGRP